MRTLVMAGPCKLEIEDRPSPTVGPREVLLEVRLAGICGSDIHGFSGATGRRTAGMIMGHEIAGQISTCSQDPTLVGATATVFPVISCGNCPRCHEDLPALCADARVIGVSPDLPGGFAEQLVVPWANVVPMSGVAPLQAAIVEPLAVGWHAARAGDVDGRSVTVLGAGGIGVMTATAARLLGARCVYVVDRSQIRCDQARLLGLTAPADAASDSREWLAQINGGATDVVIDTVGTAASLKSALVLSRKAGTVVVVGLGAPTVELPLFDIVTADRRLLGSFAYSRSDFMAAASRVRAGDVRLPEDTHRTVNFDGASAAMNALAQGLDEVLRVFVSPTS